MNHLQLEELPYSLDSCRIFERLRDLELPVFLDSAAPYSQRGRYDIITAQPRKKITQKHSLTTPYSDKVNLFIGLKETLSAFNQPLANDYKLPFIGGAIGYFGYDLGRQLEKLPAIAKQDLSCPDALIGIYDWAVIIDHHNRRSLLMAHPQASPSLLADIRLRLKSKNPQQENPFELLKAFRPNLSKQQYRSAFERTQQYIQSGDCYQSTWRNAFPVNTMETHGKLTGNYVRLPLPPFLPICNTMIWH